MTPNKSNLDYDVIIVGAGPAGSTAAKILAEQGIRSILIDKEKFPRDKPCGGGLTSRVLTRFPYIKDLNVIESSSYGSCLYSPSLQHQAELHKKDPIISMVLRKKFDDALVKLAIDSGAQFQEGKSIVNLKTTPKKARVILDDGTGIHADIIIGADGFFSTIARKAGLLLRHKYMGISVVEEFPLNAKDIEKFYTTEHLCHIHHNVHEITGYGWVFPKKRCVNIGLVDYRISGDSQSDKKNLRKIFDNYLSLLKNTNLIPKNITSKRLCGGHLPLRPLKQTYTSHIILCGDAAGFINPLNGEGIYYALASGEISARVAVEATQADDISEQFLSRYEQQWKSDFGQEIISMLKLAKQFGQQSEKIIRLMSQDEKLLEMLLLNCNWKNDLFKLQ